MTRQKTGWDAICARLPAAAQTRAGGGRPGPTSRNVHGREPFRHTEYHPGHGLCHGPFTWARRCDDATSPSRATTT
jgi:hypothetical protein